MAAWHFSRQGQIFGPFTFEQLRDLARQGKVLPADLVCREGDSKWTSARDVSGLFPTAEAEPSAAAPWFAAGQPGTPKPIAPASIASAPRKPHSAAPAVLVPLKPIAAETPSAGFVPLLLSLPKPILFGLFGGAGGLLGALLLGEILWLILSPTGLKARPHLQLGAPPSLRIYPGGKNRFLVNVARHGFMAPVVVEAASTPNEVRVSGVQIPPGEDQAEIEVQVADRMPLGPTPITIQVRSLGEKPIPPVSATVNVAVEPMPPSLAVAVSPRVSVDQGGKGRFTVRVGRARFKGAVALQFGGIPERVSLPNRVIQADQTDATLDVDAGQAAAVGVSPITVQATALGEGNTVSNTAKFDLVVNTRPIPTVDVVFLLDLTGSMQFAIDGVKKGIQGFVEQMSKENLDARIGVLCFRDIEHDKEAPFMLEFADGSVFTKDYRAVRDKVAPLRAGGGGDEPESSLQALDFATGQPFRPKAARVLVLITDASAKIHNLERIRKYSPREKITTIDECIEALKKNEIDQLHLMIRQKDLDGSYKKFKSEFPGEFIDIQNAISKGPDAFAGLLPILSKAISRITVASVPRGSATAEPPPLPTERATGFPPETAVPVLKAVQSTQAFDARDSFRVLIATMVWTGVIAACISLFIVAGQQFHSRQSWVGLPEGGRGVAGGLLAGLVGGAVGQIVFQSTTGGGLAWESISRVLGWSFLGGLIGAVMAFFVPNLKWSRGMLGGLLGGVLGAVGFVLVSMVLGALLGRLIGSAILGFCIGLMVALAELAFRRWWLEIAVSAREVRTVTLGTATVSVGGDEKLASYFIAGAPPVALRYWIENDRVLCEDAATGETTELEPGDRRTVGRVAITVCSPASTKQTGYTLHLSSGKAVLLQEGMPLTADDLPGLQPRGQDGIVALVSRHPTQPQEVTLRNRSGQSWSIRTPDGAAQVVEPGRGVELTAGVQVNFGQVHGSIRTD